MGGQSGCRGVRVLVVGVFEHSASGAFNLARFSRLPLLDRFLGENGGDSVKRTHSIDLSLDFDHVEGLGSDEVLRDAVAIVRGRFDSRAFFDLGFDETRWMGEVQLGISAELVRFFLGLLGWLRRESGARCRGSPKTHRARFPPSPRVGLGIRAGRRTFRVTRVGLLAGFRNSFGVVLVCERGREDLGIEPARRSEMLHPCRFFGLLGLLFRCFWLCACLLSVQLRLDELLPTVRRCLAQPVELDTNTRRDVEPVSFVLRDDSRDHPVDAELRPIGQRRRELHELTFGWFEIRGDENPTPANLDHIAMALAGTHSYRAGEPQQDPC